jgi:trehalose-phosphatase
MSTNIPYDALILDLDGVITDTRDLHFKAWKETFDELLSEEVELKSFEDEDYALYVDGKPREEGIRSFIEARKIFLPEDKLRELAQKKDELFLKKLRRVGPRVFQDSIMALKHWREEGIPMAVVSSSRNCSEVLERAGLKGFFDVQVDSITAEKAHLRGKPEADYFLEAAHLLNKRPEESAIIEDSMAGIQAGIKGHFKGVIGVSRKGQTPPSLLYAEGADLVVNSLEQIGLHENALRAWESILQKIGEREIALFLDFDGTISEIVPDPDKAQIRPSIFPLLKDCSRSFKTAIISGRDRQDVKRRVNIENIFYAGCHGFDISGPGGFHFVVEEASEILPHLVAARRQLETLLEPFSGMVVEDKKFFTAVHYRHVASIKENDLKEKIRKLVSHYDKLAIREGKKVIEIGPNLNWNKGTAIKKLCEVLEINFTEIVPIFVGDDLTDEDGYKEVRGKGISIKVTYEEPGITEADYWLNDPAEVEKFILFLTQHFTGREKKWRHGT